MSSLKGFTTVVLPLKAMISFLLFHIYWMNGITYCSAYISASNPNYRKSIARFSSSPPPTSTLEESTTTTTTLSPSTIADTTPIQWEFKGHSVYAEICKPKPFIFETKNLAEKTGKFLFGGDSDYLTNNRRRRRWWGSTNTRPAIVLVHGFACSTTYWRETIKAFTSAGYNVHALDLLGQGRSAKPGRSDGIEYSISLWAEQVQAYCDQYIPSEEGIVVMGNSLGSLVALSAATGDFANDIKVATSANADPETDTPPPPPPPSLPSRIQGIGMYNCGVGLNTRNLLKDPELNGIQKAIFTKLFDLLDRLIFANEPLLGYVLERIVSPDLLRKTLLGLYQCSPDPESRVDETLVQSFFQPSQDQGSAETLSQIYTNDPGKTPMELTEQYADLLQTIPLHLVWGTQDQVTPLDGIVGKFYVQLMRKQQFPVSMSVVEAGHVPFDEIPESNEFMVQWLEEVVTMEVMNNNNNNNNNNDIGGPSKTIKNSTSNMKKTKKGLFERFV